MLPALLREHQHELRDEAGDTSFVFGTEDTGYLTLSRPTITGGDPRNGDVDRPGEDGRDFGVDYHGGKTYSFEVGVLTDWANTILGITDPHRDNVDFLDRLETVWRSERWREDRDAIAVLRSHTAGQTWRCYGRPGRYDEAVGKLTEQGYTPVGFDFRLIDDKWYSDYERVLDLRLPVSQDLGGFIAPLVAPIASVRPSGAANVAVIGGSRRTWPVIEFHGPVDRPKVRVGPFTCGLDKYLADGEVVTVDPRPWRRVATRADGASYAGALSNDTPPLPDMLLPLGNHEVWFSGVSESGRARCVIRWRDARSRP